MNLNGSGVVNVAVAQMNSGANKDANIASALNLIDRAAASGARLVALPEVWAYLGPDAGNRDSAESIPGPITERLAERARRHGVFIHGGSILEIEPGDPAMYNTAFVIDPQGDIIARYRKIHMFDVELDGVAQYRESATVTPGSELVVTEIDGLPFGLATCYDLRFPELFRILALRGAKAVVLPAAFTMTTGKDHWEVLIRARAIENQIYLIAPAQWGQHPPANWTPNRSSANGHEAGRSTDTSGWQWSYGRSIIVDPWGTVLATAPDGVGLAHATIDPARVEAIRRQIPSLANRKPDCYIWPDAALVASSAD